ncbi:MAG: HIT family protein [Deltaproteobacteria bacterium HGW-Deltaproteobacteria-15]|jgi:histidine triad (HIT) family protein|nr:MAG: HIT family protein [Deltaproteobacteria bacterium HGW-Deltaproteobacteria-15]
MAECIFCKIVRGEMPCFKMYENEYVLAFADINPISKGHTLIVPKKHFESLWEIQDEDLSAIHLASRKLAHAIRESLKPLGLAALQLNGKGANQVVMHYHLHLIPRLGGSPSLPMTEWEFKPGNRDAIRETAQKIAAAVK